MATETTTTNPTLLQEQVASLLVQPLEAQSVVLASSPKIFDTSSPLRIPRLTSGASVGFVAEGAQIPEGDVSFDEVKLLPSDLKSLKVIVRFTNELIRQSVIGLDAVLKTRLVTDVANALDTALLSGTGATKTIKGIVNQAGVQTGVLDADNPDSYLDAIAKAHAAEVTPNRWFINSQDFIALRKAKDSQGRYLLETDLTADAVYRLFGIQVTPTNKLATGKAILLDTNQVAIARDLAPSVTLLPELYAATDETAIRVVARFDLGLLHPEGVVVLTAA
ncbi:phage major capsid protein [Gordonia sp. w5E2]|uniref:Capsid protein n=3 Tax=Gordonia TaxID=2053 RepID=A0ABR5I7V0_9ACTN|nr:MULTISPECIES: phage major capsid protein [Gordonia]KNA89679.1 capsid protein [Gordonia jacobaea]HQV19580.1 phage major capsid protein [Gordonia sp. (in: high G+C Gram-positive bacteria)]